MTASDPTATNAAEKPSVPQARGAGRHLVQRHSRRGEPISGEDDEWDYRGHAGDVAIYQLFAVRGLNLLVAPSEVPVITAMSKEAEVITAAVFETVMRSTPRARLLDLFDGSRGDAMAVVVDGEVAPYDTWLMNLALRALPVDDISASDVGVGRARGAAQGAICMAVKRGGISYVATVMPLDATVVEVVQLPRLDLDAEVSRVGE